MVAVMLVRRQWPSSSSMVATVEPGRFERPPKGRSAAAAQHFGGHPYIFAHPQGDENKAIYQPFSHATSGHRGAYHEPLQSSQEDIPAGVSRGVQKGTFASDGTILHHIEATRKPPRPRAMQVCMAAAITVTQESVSS